MFLALVPVALLAFAATWVWVPESNDPAAARLDPPGLAASSAAIGILVYTIIEAPDRGWGAPSRWRASSSRSSSARSSCGSSAAGPTR